MGRCLKAAALAAAVACLAPTTAAAGPRAVAGEVPFWMASETIRERIDAAGTRGLTYDEIEVLVRSGAAGLENADEPVAEPCATVEPDTRPGSIHTNACITYPGGCTANFLYHDRSTPFTGVADGRNDFIGTAGHCVDHSGQPVYMDNATGSVVLAGHVFKHVDGGPGNDFALVRILPGFPLDPEMPFVEGAPTGIYTGCAGGQQLTWWGHGYGVAVGQGQPGIGSDATWYDRVFTWRGDALPGDSGSGMVIAASGQAAGNLTHLVLDPDRYGLDFNAGTRQTHIQALARNLAMVNADGSLADAPRNTRCGNPNNGSS